MSYLIKRLRSLTITGHNPDGPPPIKYHPKIADEAADEIERLRAREREAFRAGYWAWCGPANQPEYDEAVKDELEAWDKWSASVGVEQRPGEKG